MVQLTEVEDEHFQGKTDLDDGDEDFTDTGNARVPNFLPWDAIT
jgi:hypothetical protein